MQICVSLQADSFVLNIFSSPEYVSKCRGHIMLWPLFIAWPLLTSSWNLSSGWRWVTLLVVHRILCSKFGPWEVHWDGEGDIPLVPVVFLWTPRWSDSLSFVLHGIMIVVGGELDTWHVAVAFCVVTWHRGWDQIGETMFYIYLILPGAPGPWV